MSELKLIEAIIAGDIDRIGTLIDSGTAVGQSDSHSWTALNWAAAKGYTGIIQKLLDAGADITHTGRDNRTAYQEARQPTSWNATGKAYHIPVGLRLSGRLEKTALPSHARPHRGPP